MSKTIKFTKKGGEIQYKDYVLKNLENAFRMLTNGEHIINISKQVRKRTVDQNRLMWLWFACIEQETGQEKNDIHDHYCLEFLSRSISFNGLQERVVSGTRNLSTIGMKDFLDNVQADVASEFGITLPNPDDLHWREFEEQYKHFI